MPSREFMSASSQYRVCCQVRQMAFGSWASREVWLKLARPKGFPPNMTCIGSPINGTEVAKRLSCPECDEHLETTGAVRRHVEASHTYVIFPQSLFMCSKRYIVGFEYVWPCDLRVRALLSRHSSILYFFTLFLRLLL